MEGPDQAETPLPLGQRARVARAVLAVVIAAAVLSLWADARQLELLQRAVDGERITLQEAQESDDRVGTTAILYTIVSIVAAITFLLWYGRAYRNTIALGLRGPRYGTRWAIAYWFIPIVNLFRPKQVVNDIWRASDPERPAGEVRWDQGSVPALIHLWWAVWLISGFVSTIAVRATFSDPHTTAELRDEAAGYLVADGVDIVAAALALTVVGALSRRLELRRSRFEDGLLPRPPGAPAPSGP